MAEESYPMDFECCGDCGYAHGLNDPCVSVMDISAYDKAMRVGN